ncbi:MAG: hypothetical protein HQ492_06550, partial [Woeseiaceae bacterium]|nr:hypothetical protein [Woeseiaceae bacterium]
SQGGGSQGGGSQGGGGSEGGGGSQGGGGSPSGGVQGIGMPGIGGGPDGGGGGGAGGEDCSDGGISGGGFGGGTTGCDQAGGVGQFPGDSERAEKLGEELDKSVGDFDEALGEEQRQVQSVGQNTEGFGDGSGGKGGTISMGEQEAGASGGSAGGGAGGAAGSAESQAGPLDGMSDEQIQARTPDDIEVNSFEDVVARQLREAALAEDDPKLRERLWEEYRKYTGLK